MEVNEITGEIIRAAIKVHSRLGPGLLEGVYRACLCYQLRKRGLVVRTEVPLPIEYDGIHIDAGFRIDLLVEELVIVELKAVTRMTPLFDAQILSYLKLSNRRFGLLINFHVTRLKNGIRRIVNGWPAPQ